MKKIKFLNLLIVSVFLTLGLSISLQNLLAQWASPTDNPPADQVDSIVFDTDSSDDMQVSMPAGNDFIVDGSINLTGEVYSGQDITSFQSVVSSIDASVGVIPSLFHGEILAGGNANNFLLFEDNSSEMLRVDSSGNVTNAGDLEVTGGRIDIGAGGYIEDNGTQLIIGRD